MTSAKHKLGIIFFPAYDWAIDATHPEREERLLYTQDQLKEEGVFDLPGIKEFKPEIVDRQTIELTHFCFPDVAAVTTESHLIAAGGAVKAARLVMDGEVERAFALVRPPGHHAMKVVHGNRGFCNINNEAIMIEFIREHYGQRKIAIVDTDCHHGDGTQDIYWHDPHTLFISLHQDGRTLYPGSGFVRECGGPNASGKTVNIPLPPQTGDEGFIKVIDEVVLPILEDFQPDLIVNSAGQDNHYTDPITNMCFSARGYARLNEKLGPHLAVLEGGYSIQGALPYVNLGIVLAMAGIDYSHVREPDYDPERLRQSRKITDYIDNLCREVMAQYRRPPRSSLADGEFDHRQKSIYYDTDGIAEDQVEKVMVCRQCAGLRLIETRALSSQPSLGIEIPLGACSRCREAGLKILRESKNAMRYRQIKLINRVDREYLSFSEAEMSPRSKYFF
ncbi:MAG: histone deacetylase [Deltaproteobacteria bacterium]|jgi:acetoin utilization deacetylase AcuC-like enzyme|nr:histone deacetylase [Deltaproteobacteria bacterium]